MNKQLLEDLQRVDDLITEGWCRGASESNGHYCLIGAAAVALGKQSWDNDGRDDGRHNSLLKTLADELPKDFRREFNPADRLWHWNDEKASDKRAVLRLIRRARRRLEREEQEAAK